jgi:uncharacterized protein
MQFIEQTHPTRAITQVQQNCVHIGESVLRQSFLLDAQGVENIDLADVAALSPAHLESIAQRAPEVVLLATGARIQFPSAKTRAAFLSRGIGLEVMDLHAAARTYNVLLAEQRRVLLLAIL